LKSLKRIVISEKVTPMAKLMEYEKSILKLQFQHQRKGRKEDQLRKRLN